MKIVRETQSFGNLAPNDTFRRVIGAAAFPCELPVSNLCMVVKDGDYCKAYDLQDHVLLSMRKTSPVIRVRSELVIKQENN